MKRMPLDPARDALVVVDLQNDFCGGGALPVAGGEEIVPLINTLMPRFKQVALTQDWHPPGHLSFASAHPGKAPFEEIAVDYGPQMLWPDHCVQGQHGAEFHPLLLTRAARFIVRKGIDRAIDSYSAFYENDHRTPTGLSSALSEIGVKRIFLVGLATDFCVRYTALDARRLDFKVVLIEDACRGIDREGSLAAARAAMQAAGAVSTRSSQIV